MELEDYKKKILEMKLYGVSYATFEKAVNEIFEHLKVDYLKIEHLDKKEEIIIL